jgi:hypothetical protein
MALDTERTESGLDGEYVAGPLEHVRKRVADYEATAGGAGRDAAGPAGSDPDVGGRGIGAGPEEPGDEDRRR